MVVISRFLGVALRASQLASAVIVAGIIGHFLYVHDDRGWYPGGRFVFTEVVAGLAILSSLILLVPFVWALTPLPWDFVMFLLWIITFGLLADYIAPADCSWYVSWNPIYNPDAGYQEQCDTFKTSLAFQFISAMLWLASFFLGIWIVRRVRRSRDPTIRRRPWYRSHVV